MRSIERPPPHLPEKKRIELELYSPQGVESRNSFISMYWRELDMYSVL